MALASALLPLPHNTREIIGFNILLLTKRALKNKYKYFVEDVLVSSSTFFFAQTYQFMDFEFGRGSEHIPTLDILMPCYLFSHKY